MESSIKKEARSHVILNVEASAEDMAEYRVLAIAKLKETADIKGFRKGEVDDESLIAHIGDNALMHETIQQAMNPMFVKAAMEHKLQPISQSVVKISSTEPLKVEYSFDVFPEVSLGDVSADLKKEEITVSGDELNESIDHLLLSRGELIPSDEVAKEGDHLEIDFEGEFEGKKLDELASKNHPLILGSKKFIPGFEEELIGLKTGDSKTFDIVFPKTYHSEKYAGNTVTFTTTVQKIQILNKPEFNDDFCKLLTGKDDATTDFVKVEVKKGITEQKTKQQTITLENTIIEALVEKVTVEVPQSMLDEEIAYMRGNLEHELSQQNVSVEDYFKKNNTDEESVKKEWLPQAEKRIKSRLGLIEFAKKNKIDVDKDEITPEMLQKYLDNKVPAEQANNIVKSELLMKKALESLLEQNIKN